MNGKHWSDDELLDRLYGLVPEDDHLNVCPECGARWQQLVSSRRGVVRGALAAEAAIDSVRLRRQREAVMNRIDRSNHLFMPWRAVTALAGVGAMVLGFMVYHPERPKPLPVQTASSDSQFFSEIYSDLQETEPRAARPIRKLFQEKE
jgi:hypothetical protein